MANYNPPMRGVSYVFFVGLVSQADVKVLQSSATLAAGDVKVSIDGGALTNLGTLPVVTPAASKMVKVTLSAAEMLGDNVTVLFSDAAGAQWCDLVINLQPSSLLPTGTVLTNAANTASLFKTDLASTTTSFWVDTWITFTSGALAGQTKQVSAYNSGKFITVSTPFTEMPVNGDSFILVNQ